MPTGLEPDPDPRPTASAWLAPAEVDLLCAFAEVAPPFPLRVGVAADRTAAFADARAGLAARGLADGRGPRGLAADFVHLLREGKGAVDVLVARRGGAVGALALAQRDEAVLVTQDLGVPDAPAHLTAVSTHDAVEGVLRLVPELDAAMAAGFTLPRAAIDEVYRDLMAGGHTRDRLDKVLRGHDVDEQTLSRLVTHLQPVLGNGQAGTAVRRGLADEWVRSGEEVRWLDTARGRFLVAGAPDGEWLSVNPFSRDDLRAQLRLLAGSVWR